MDIKNRYTGKIIKTVDGADLRGAKFTGAKLMDADLTGADLTGAKNINSL